MSLAPDLRGRLRQRITDQKTSSLPKRRSFNSIVLSTGLAATVLLSVGLALKIRTLDADLRARDSAIAEVTRHLEAREATLNSILEPGVELTTMVATGTAPPVVQLFYDRTQNTVMLHSFRLPPIPVGKAYQLWFLRGGGAPLPSQTFRSDPDGHRLIEAIRIPAGEQITGFALSVEPEAGSPQPTSTPILVGQVGGAR